MLHPVNAGITGAHNFRDGMPSFDGIYSKVVIKSVRVEGHFLGPAISMPSFDGIYSKVAINQLEFNGMTWVPHAQGIKDRLRL